MPTEQEIISEIKAHLNSGRPLTSEEEQSRLALSYSYALDRFTIYMVSGKDELKLDDGAAIMKPNLLLNFVERIARLRLVNEQIEAAKAMNVEARARAEQVRETQAKVTIIKMEGPEWTTPLSTDSTAQA